MEVSLDIDLDTLYSDPAPLEALVQRFGRVNRQRKQSGLATVHVYRLPDDGQKIYDAELVRRTLAILEREQGQPVDESAIGRWLDEIYSGEVAARWQKEYTHTATEFQATRLRTLRAFDSDLGLEKEFDKLFDGIEVLPQSLYDDYRKLKEQEPLRADELLVPMRWGRYHMLSNQGRIQPPAEKGEPYIVKADYDSDMGLQLARTDPEEDGI